jgi:hypothetical protein
MIPSRLAAAEIRPAAVEEDPETMTDSSGGRPRPASRYGRPGMSARARRRVAIGLGLLVVAAGVGLAAVAYQRFEGVDVSGESAAFEVLDDRTVSITISVTRKDPSRPVVCIVRARSRDGAETGRREIVVPPAADRTIQVTTTVKSYTRPFVGDIYGCGTEIPGYLSPD